MEVTGASGLRRRTRWLLSAAAVLLLALPSPAGAQTCATANDMDPATRSALQQAGQQFFQMAASGNLSAMQAQTIPNLASSFGGVTAAVNENKANFAGAKASIRDLYLLEAPGTAPIPQAEFYCGVWGTPDFTGFGIANLPPGTYAVVMEDVTGGKTPLSMFLVLRQETQDGWKLAGFYTKLAQVAGHDANWFLEQARQFKTTGQTHNAWLYYMEAIELLKPVPFMSTRQIDKVYSEAETVKPPDMPPGAALTIAAGGKTFTINQVYGNPVSSGLDLVAKYQSPDISNTLQTYRDNLALASALVAKYPEFRQAFSGVLVIAIGANNTQYSTPVVMKDVK